MRCRCAKHRSVLPGGLSVPRVLVIGLPPSVHNFPVRFDVFRIVNMRCSVT